MWTVKKWDGSNWIDDYFPAPHDTTKVFIPNPGNRTFDLATESNARVESLYDGDRAIVVPQVKSREEAFDFEITEYQLQEVDGLGELTQPFLEKMKQYVRELTGLLLQTHTGAYLEGHLLSARKTYTLSGEEQRYVLVLRFQPFDVNNDGVIGT